MQSLSWPVTIKSRLRKVANPHYFSDPIGLTDDELIEKSLGADNRAFKQLVERHLKAVYNFLYQITKDYSSLDDLTQETFIKVWKNLSRFESSKSFKVWIFTIARNTAYDFLRKKNSKPLALLGEEANLALENICDKEPLPQELLERESQEKKLEAMLKNIPEQQRIVLLLHYKQDFSLKEIAEIFNEPYSTIKSRHKRAILSLKKARSSCSRLLC